MDFAADNAKALACNNDDTCTIAQKEIYVLTSNASAEAVQENIRDIAKYIEDIEAEKAKLVILEEAFSGIEAGSKPAIEAAEAE